MKRILVLAMLATGLVGCRGGVLDSGGWNDDPKPAAAPDEPQAKRRDSPLPVGANVPAFSVADQEGRAVTAGELAVGPGAVLVFVPGNDPGAAGVVYTWARREQNFLKGRGLELLLVLRSDVETAATVAGREELRMALLADTKGTLGGTFGVGATSGTHTFLLVEGRVHLAQPGLPDSASLVFAASSRPGNRSGSIIGDIF